MSEVSKSQSTLKDNMQHLRSLTEVLNKIEGTSLKVGVNPGPGYHVYDESGILFSGRTKKIVADKIVKKIEDSEPQDVDALTLKMAFINSEEPLLVV